MFVAGGRGVWLLVRQPAVEFWLPATTVDVIAPESVNAPAGVWDSRTAAMLGRGASTAPQLVEVTKSAITESAPTIVIERTT
jgi:hypothetical protein